MGGPTAAGGGGEEGVGGTLRGGLAPNGSALDGRHTLAGSSVLLPTPSSLAGTAGCLTPLAEARRLSIPLLQGLATTRPSCSGSYTPIDITVHFSRAPSRWKTPPPPRPPYQRGDRFVDAPFWPTGWDLRTAAVGVAGLSALRGHGARGALQGVRKSRCGHREGDARAGWGLKRRARLADGHARRLERVAHQVSRHRESGQDLPRMSCKYRVAKEPSGQSSWRQSRVKQSVRAERGALRQPALLVDAWCCRCKPMRISRTRTPRFRHRSV